MNQSQKTPSLNPSTEGQRSLSDRVYEEIYRRVSSDEWPIGTRLPNETDLSSQFAVSRSVVREALVRLRADGLITSKPHTGSYVTGHPNRMVLERARIYSISDIQRCFEFRTGIEGEAAYLAALRQSQGKIAKIQVCIEAMKTWRDSTTDSDGSDEDIAFHMAIASATENNYFVSAMDSMSLVIRLGISIGNTLVQFSGGRKSSPAYDEHVRIYDAIASGDAETARTCMRTHIENTRRRAFVGG